MTEDKHTDDEPEDALRSDLELDGDKFYEAPDSDTLYQAYIETLRNAFLQGEIDLVKQEYRIFLYESDMQTDPELESIRDKLQGIFDEILPGYKPRRIKDKIGPQQNLFKDFEP